MTIRERSAAEIISFWQLGRLLRINSMLFPRVAGARVQVPKDAVSLLGGDFCT